MPPGDAPASPLFWSESTTDLLGRLHTEAAGLTSDEAARRLVQVGPNAMTASTHASTLALLARQFSSPITILLAVAAALSLFAGEGTDGGIILGILVVSGLLGFWQEARAADAVARLLARVQTTAAVKRDGVVRDLPRHALVPGDVVLLQAGASVPGDARLLASADLFVDEAALTGESYPAEKGAGDVAADAPLSARTNVVFLGTHVVSGTATAVVVHTGRRTEYGAIAARLAVRGGDTEFERGVRRFGGFLLQVALVLALVVLTINVRLDRPVLDALLFTLALTVGLTPQLLPAIVSVTLAHGARVLAREQVIVRRLGAIEDLGGMDILCTDKTGTITEGVVAMQGAEDWRSAPCDHAFTMAALNAGVASGFANPIDDALRRAAPAATDGWRKLDEVPYDFVRKRLTVAVERHAACDAGRAASPERLLITKGAVRQVLEVCTTVRDAAGADMPIAVARETIEARVQALSQHGRRCIGVASRALETVPIGRADERDMTFLGLISFEDPLKPGAADTLAELTRLGIRTALVTGDNRYVAAHVAQQAGMRDAPVLTGPEIDRLQGAALSAAVAGTDVFAELEPRQKERIIVALKQAGHAVGFLGDGINDAAALHAADCGISVDTASDVTREAADLVLLRKDLRVLVQGVREGRRTFANTLKYVFITTSANFGNMLSMALASYFTAFLPMLPTQVLLLNVLSDLPAMAIATDRLDPELLAEPRRWRTDEIRRFMITFGLVSSVFDVLTFGTLLALHVPPATFRTAWFLESLLSELLVLLVIRTRRPLLRSRPSTTLLVVSVVVTAAALAIPVFPASASLGFAPLSWRVLSLVTGIVVAYGAATETTKHLVHGRHVGF